MATFVVQMTTEDGEYQGKAAHLSDALGHMITSVCDGVPIDVGSEDVDTMKDEIHQLRDELVQAMILGFMT